MHDISTPDSAPRTKEKFFSRTSLAAALTAICTVMVALSAFASAKAASDSDDQYALAGQQLADANFWYTQGAEVLREDLSAFLDIEADQYCTISLVFDGADATCDDLSADELAEAIAWTNDDDVLAEANANQALADDTLASGLANSTKAVDYQAALVLFAIGLALSAWASLSDVANRAQLMFIVLAVVSLSGGFVRLLTI